jgi:peptide/nickel transport system ATP-binding protein
VTISSSQSARCFKTGQVPEATKPKLLTRVSGVKNDAVLSVEGVSAAYSGNVVVHDINLSIRKGECLALVGESGSGKTTVSRCIGGLHREWTGRIVYDGHDLKLHARKRSVEQRLGIQYVFQNPYGSLNPRRTVRDSIVRPLIIGGMSGKDADSIVVDVLDKVSLPASYGGKYPDQLSGGERQRVAIARALVSNPDVLVCDEITSALDVLVQAAIVDLLGTLRRELGLAMLFVTHNLPLVRSIADEVAVMNQGRIVEIGTAEEVIGNPREDYTRRLISATPSIERSLS